MARQEPAELRALLRERLVVALAPAGWVAAGRGSSFVLAEFVRQLDHEMAATATVGLATSVPDRLPVTLTDLLVGVSYEPLRALWPLLGDRYRLALLHESVSLTERAGEDDDPRQEDEPGLNVASRPEAEAAVDRIAALVLKDGLTVAESFSTREALLMEFGYVDPPVSVQQPAVAILAAAGRFEDARRALGCYRPVTGHRDEDREARRFVRQIGRYIDSRGDASIVPDEPPPSTDDAPERPSVSDAWRHSRARGEAVRAVRAMSSRSGRGELHAALERELTARGLTESPLWLEQTLDHLYDTRADTAQQLAKGAAGAASLASKGIRALREHRPLPNLTPPANSTPKPSLSSNGPTRRYPGCSARPQHSTRGSRDPASG